MKRNYPPSCKPCSVYKYMVLENNINCALSIRNRPKCPCTKCLIFSMCNKACDKFKRKRRAKILDRGRI